MAIGAIGKAAKRQNSAFNITGVPGSSTGGFLSEPVPLSTELAQANIRTPVLKPGEQAPDSKPGTEARRRRTVLGSVSAPPDDVRTAEAASTDEGSAQPVALLGPALGGAFSTLGRFAVQGLAALGLADILGFGGDPGETGRSEGPGEQGDNQAEETDTIFQGLIVAGVLVGAFIAIKELT